MKVGDLVQRIKLFEGADHKRFNSLAIIVGFDDDGDLRLLYANPGEGWENEEDIDYKSAWKLVNATN